MADKENIEELREFERKRQNNQEKPKMHLIKDVKSPKGSRKL